MEVWLQTTGEKTAHVNPRPRGHTSFAQDLLRRQYKSILTFAVFGLLLIVPIRGCAGATRIGHESRPDDAGELVRLQVGTTWFEFVRIDAGTFWMGSRESEPGHRPDEEPFRRVAVLRPFLLGRCEVTQAQWQAVMGENPSWYKGANLPVNRVSLRDCQEFCKRLSRQVHMRVRLPSETEWEYACRAESQTAYCFGESPSELERYAWYAGHAPRQPSPVQQKAPNAWGLFDMYGNVWEWCADPYRPRFVDSSINEVSTAPGGGELAVLRGGSWFHGAEFCRSARRFARIPEMRSGYIGLRLAADIE